MCSPEPPVSQVPKVLCVLLSRMENSIQLIYISVYQLNIKLVHNTEQPQCFTNATISWEMQTGSYVGQVLRGFPGFCVDKWENIFCVACSLNTGFISANRCLWWPGKPLHMVKCLHFLLLLKTVDFPWTEICFSFATLRIWDDIYF